MTEDTATSTVTHPTTDGSALHPAGRRPRPGRRLRTSLTAAAAGILCLATLATAAEAAEAEEPRPYGYVKVLSEVPTPPGLPEGIALKGIRVDVAPGSSENGNSSGGAYVRLRRQGG